MSDRLLSVVIVNWNVRELLGNCLRSLFACNPALDLEVCVVDNASQDGSIEFLRHNFPQINLIENDSNVGFSQANNQGIGKASGRYILLLNPDTVWLDDSLSQMVYFLENNKEIGVIGPKLLNADRTSIQYMGARRLPRPSDTFFEYTRLSTWFPNNGLFGRSLMGEWDHLSSREVECLSGACLLIRAEVIEDVGLLDEGYGLYVEDIDWCHRVFLSKWKLFYLVDAQLVHIGRQSTLQIRGPSTIRALRGWYRYYHKFYGMPTTLWAWFLLWLVSLGKFCIWLLIFLLKKRDRQSVWGELKVAWQILWLSPLAK